MSSAFPSQSPATAIADLLPGAYHQEAAVAFRGAEAAGGAEEIFLDLDGHRIRLRFAGKHFFSQIRPTLAHLQAPAGPAEFTICCWDDERAGSLMPYPLQWMFQGYAYGSMPFLSNARFRTFYVEWPQSLSIIDLESRTAYCCYLRGSDLPLYETAGPLRPVVNTILNQWGMQLVHASAIGTEKGSVLFVGAPMSGKSTIALHGLVDGLSYQSDDLCVLTSEIEPRSLSLYQMAKLRDDALGRFPSLRPLLTRVQEQEETRSLFYVHDHFPARLLKSAPVRALILPSVVDEPTSRLEPAAHLDAIRELVSWTMREIPRGDGMGEKIMLQAVGRLPAWHLFMGRDPAQTLKLIRGLLDAA